MNKIILYSFFIFLFLSENSKAQWTEIFNDTNYFWISDVKFLNSDTGFACGSWDLNPTPGIVLKTINGGLSWDTTWVGDWMMSLSIVNDSIIYTGGVDAEIFKTIDRGGTWIRQGGGFPCCPDMSSIFFLNPDTAFTLDFSSRIWRKTSGINWNASSLPGAESDYPNNSSIQFLNHQDGFIAMKKIYRTSNTGDTWQQLNIDSNRYFTSLYMKNLNEGIAVDDSGHVSLTSDGGITWTDPQFLGPYPFYDVAFVNDSIGYIVGGNDDYHSLVPFNYVGVIYITHDGGITWSLLQTFDHALTSLYFVNDSVGYAVGHRGKILKITNANRVGINEVETESYFSISPNPTHSSFTITTTTQLQNAQIEIYNLLGEKMYTAVYCGLKTVDCGLFPKGIYFVKLQTEKGSAVQKLVVQ